MKNEKEKKNNAELIMVMAHIPKGCKNFSFTAEKKNGAKLGFPMLRWDIKENTPSKVFGEVHRFLKLDLFDDY